MLWKGREGQGKGEAHLTTLTRQDIRQIIPNHFVEMGSPLPKSTCTPWCGYVTTVLRVPLDGVLVVSSVLPPRTKLQQTSLYMIYALLYTFISMGQIPRNGISGSKVKILITSGDPVTVSEKLSFWFCLWGHCSAERRPRSLVVSEPWQVHKARDVGTCSHASQRGFALTLVGPY